MDNTKPSAATWIILLIGIVLFVSPWVVGLAGTLDADNAMLIGGLMAICAALAISTHNRFPDGWVNFVLITILLSVESIIVPPLLKFADAAFWTQVPLGLAVILFAAIELFRVTRLPGRLTA